MDKVEYLIKTFSRTKRKDYENYILNAVWQKIDCLDLRPVTQQYVKGHDNEYYLIDLYFPQINIGVEVDEAFHKNNVESDLKRELTIEEKLSSIREESLFELKTISEDRKSCEYHKVSDRLYIDYENEKLLMQAFI